jgi:peroxiredoxin
VTAEANAPVLRLVRGDADQATPQGRLPGMRDTLAAAVIQSGASLLELSQDSPTLVVFLRQLGSVFCREALADLSAARAQIEAGGVRIVLVHMAADARAKDLLADYWLADLPRISDSARVLYRAFGVPRATLAGLFGWSVLRRAMRAWRRGHRPGRIAGDLFQLAGAFLISEGRILRAARCETATEQADPRQLALAPIASVVTPDAASNPPLRFPVVRRFACD